MHAPNAPDRIKYALMKGHTAPRMHPAGEPCTAGERACGNDGHCMLHGGMPEGEGDHAEKDKGSGETKETRRILEMGDHPEEEDREKALPQMDRADGEVDEDSAQNSGMENKGTGRGGRPLE